MISSTRIQQLINYIYSLRDEETQPDYAHNLLQIQLILKLFKRQYDSEVSALREVLEKVTFP